MNAVTESPEDRLKRLHMRSIRRGIKEMDILLTRFSEAELARLSPAELDLYDALLWENDQDLLTWITGQQPAPDRFAPLVAHIARVSTAAK
ncbi:MAG: FAD assembly factor SdhE [Pseudooceanicola sp.]